MIACRYLLVPLLLLFAAVAQGEEIVTIATRPGVTQSMLLDVPERPAAIAVLFPGGDGSIRLRRQNGEIRYAKGNFLIRSAQAFVSRGVAVAIVDTPSDEPSGMQDNFRLGDKHAADIAAVVDDLKKRFPGLPVFLIGTSRGSTSAGATASALGENIAGAVLTSTVFVGAQRGGPGMSGFDYSKIKVPVLLVHHAEDSCPFTPYRSARSIADAHHYPLVSVKGGLPATSGPCDAFSAHGYLGKETPTVEAIVNWMLKKPYAENID